MEDIPCWILDIQSFAVFITFHIPILSGRQFPQIVLGNALMCDNISVISYFMQTFFILLIDMMVTIDSSIMQLTIVGLLSIESYERFCKYWTIKKHDQMKNACKTLNHSICKLACGEYLYLYNVQVDTSKSHLRRSISCLEKK